jgi:hypothetical protein
MAFLECTLIRCLLIAVILGISVVAPTAPISVVSANFASEERFVTAAPTPLAPRFVTAAPTPLAPRIITAAPTPLAPRFVTAAPTAAKSTEATAAAANLAAALADHIATHDPALLGGDPIVANKAVGSSSDAAAPLPHHKSGVSASLVAPLVVVPLALLTAWLFTKNGDLFTLATGAVARRQAMQFSSLESGMARQTGGPAGDE